MSYSSEITGLDLFTAPFRNQQASRAAAASRPQQKKAAVPQPKPTVSPAQQPKTALPQPQTVKPTVVEPKAQAQPAKTNPTMGQAQQSDIPQKSAREQKTHALQPEQAKVTGPMPEQKPQAEAPAPVKAQPKKELTMDMSDHSIPAGKPLDMSEDAKRKAHEEAEAKRKAEWDARQLAKKQAEDAAIKNLQSMSDADVMAASTERVRLATERITRRSMKECVAEHIQELCRKDPAFARRTMHPKKSMIHCFQYINRKAKDYIQQEMEDNDIKPENGVYGGDVPDGLCYQWAVDYFNDSDAQEDKEKEEKFTPRPYVSTSSKTKKTANSKKPAKKEPEKKQEPENGYQQMSLAGVF